MFRLRHSACVLFRQESKSKLLDAVKPVVHPLQNVFNRNQGTAAIEDSYVKKFMKKVGWMDQSRTRLKLTGYFLYESIPDTVDYVKWFQSCKLEDTFNSWFNVTELHVWLLMVRCMAEDLQVAEKTKYVKGDGYFIRNCLVEALWADVGNRIKLLEGANPAIARKQVSELSELFQAALVAYDEGLDDDRVLAAAIWRRMYGMNPETSAENVEKIVLFIRRQMLELEKIHSLGMKGKPTIEWLSISSVK